MFILRFGAHFILKVWNFDMVQEVCGTSSCT